MQAVLDAEFGKDSDAHASDCSDTGEPQAPQNDLFCPACNKMFKSDKA